MTCGMTNVLRAEAVYRDGKLVAKEKLPLDEGEEVELIVVRRRGGVQTSTLYMETEKGGEKSIVQGVCLVESLPARIQDFELKDTLSALMGPGGPMLDPSIGRLEFMRMLLDKMQGGRGGS